MLVPPPCTCGPTILYWKCDLRPGPGPVDMMPMPVALAEVWCCICPRKAAISPALFRRSSVGGRVRPLARPRLFFLAVLKRRPVIRPPAAAVRPNKGGIKPVLLSRVVPLSVLAVLRLRLPAAAAIVPLLQPILGLDPLLRYHEYCGHWGLDSSKRELRPLRVFFSAPSNS